MTAFWQSLPRMTTSLLQYWGLCSVLHMWNISLKVSIFLQNSYRETFLSLKNKIGLFLLSYYLLYIENFTIVRPVYITKENALHFLFYFYAISGSYCEQILKVPKREIFDRSDFPDFYTIKSSLVGDLVVKILTYNFNFWGRCRI